jgi:hypothetical protein
MGERSRANGAQADLVALQPERLPSPVNPSAVGKRLGGRVTARPTF